MQIKWHHSFSVRTMLSLIILALVFVGSSLSNIYISSQIRLQTSNNLALSIRGMSDLEVMRDAFSNYNRKLEVWGYLQIEKRQLSQNNQPIPSSITSTIRSMQGDLDAQYNTYLNAFKDMQSFKKDTTTLNVLKRLQTDMNAFQTQYEQPLLQDPTRNMVAFSTQGQSQASQVSTDMDRLLTLEQHMDVVYKAQENQVFQSGSTVNYTLLIVGLILDALVTVFIFLNVRPIQKLVAYVKRLGQNDLLAEPVHLKVENEFGILAREIAHMAENLRSLIGNIHATASQVAATSQELTATTEESARATENIATTIQNVASGAERQSESTQSAVKSVSEMVSSTRRISENAKEVADAASHAKHVANEGQRSAAGTIAQMTSIQTTVNVLSESVSSLGHSTNEIGQIVRVITDIVSQTNPLALNAAIEAARAGEHGRGFAVVADEVRKLAEEASLRAKQIVDLISNIQVEMNSTVQTTQQVNKEVETGMNQVQVAGESFSSILSSVEGVSEQMVQVSGAVRRMSSQVEQMALEVESVSKIAQDAALHTQSVSAATEEQLASTEEISASAMALAHMAEELSATVSQFQV
ncbi:methyl-accepting chemotaxis protein [Alicyclobacillus tolerans]|uniref:methyl-accepting chemotaxis protein n=1 Tax=Alicyclobacillus tolerans TaxID=90970 RepID=UPI001F411833|nr:HAMP domain-containing methyl-accepting chemotaxis protein [Alicyclobacillus tolerans]MCF8564382.1 methyl-accepting chemotaxis protein [Alicyclobacillus tolerans]